MRVVVVLVLLVMVFSFVGARELTEVEKVALFDIFVEIPDEYHVVGVGENVLFTLRLVNLGGAGRIDVFLEYGVLDADGDVVLNKREAVAIETQASFLREFRLEGIPVGDYEIYARMVYADGKTVDGRHSFKIRDPEEGWNIMVWIIASIVLIIGAGIFLYPRIKFMRDKMRIKSDVKRIVKGVER